MPHRHLGRRDLHPQVDGRASGSIPDRPGKGSPGGQGRGPARLDAAVATVERCFIGTIHSFCARLLRERPVEAGVDVGFQELDDLADARLRQQAWEEYIAKLLATDDPILAELEGLGIEIRGLGPTFRKFCDYPDVDEWPAEKVPLPDLAPARKKLEQYIRHIRGLLETLPSDPGNDKLMPKYRLISQVARYTDLGTVVGLMAVLERFGEPGKTTVVQKNWPGGKAQALAELARWDELRRGDRPAADQDVAGASLRADSPGDHAGPAAVRSSAARGRRPELPGPA